MPSPCSSWAYQRLQLALLLDRAPVALCKDAVEHLLQRRLRASMRSARFTFRHGVGNLASERFRQSGVPRVVPRTQHDEMLLQPLDGIAEGPVRRLIFGPVFRGIIACGVAGRPIGEELDQ